MDHRPAISAFLSSGRAEIKLGTRKSALALVQTNLIKQKLEEHCPELKFAILEQSTTGDKILDVPLAKIGDKGIELR
jgi:hydroxymethylbilane synthase